MVIIGDHGKHGSHGDHGKHGSHGDHGKHGSHGDHGKHGSHGDHVQIVDLVQKQCNTFKKMHREKFLPNCGYLPTSTTTHTTHQHYNTHHPPALQHTPPTSTTTHTTHQLCMLCTYTTNLVCHKISQGKLLITKFAWQFFFLAFQ